MPREKTIVGKITDELDRRGAWWVNVHGSNMGRGGIPDILACHHGHFIAIEAKTATGRVAPRQTWELERITRAGGTATIARTLNDITQALDTIEALSHTPKQEGA